MLYIHCILLFIFDHNYIRFIHVICTYSLLIFFAVCYSLFQHNTHFFKFFIYYLFIMFIFGCVGSSFLCEGFLQLRRVGATLNRGAQASHYRGLSCCGAQAQ